jgi:putative redox protein
MITSKVTYNGSLRAEAIHIQSGSTILTDAPRDNQGKGEAFSPTDLVATALASCMLTTIAIVARREGTPDIAGAQAEVVKIMVPDPRRIGEVRLKITFPAGDYSAETRSMYEHAAHNCPVAKSLHPDLKQVTEFVWNNKN